MINSYFESWYGINISIEIYYLCPHEFIFFIMGLVSLFSFLLNYFFPEKLVVLMNIMMKFVNWGNSLQIKEICSIKRVEIEVRMGMGWIKFFTENDSSIYSNLTSDLDDFYYRYCDKRACKATYWYYFHLTTIDLC